jgi:prepilin-type N-terminal cleavage/methylation domain-containing protein
MRNKKGFTLIELLIALAIFAVVIALAGSLFVSGFRNYEKVSEILTGQTNTRYVMYDISKALRSADIEDITISEDNASITIGDVSYIYSSGSSTVSRVRDGSTVVIARDIVSFNVELSGETVNYSIQSADEKAQLNSSVTLKQFSRPSPP